MEHDPVLSSANDLIKGENTAWSVWSKFLGKKGYRIELLRDPRNGALAKYEIGTLRGLTERYADQNEWDRPSCKKGCWAAMPPSPPH